MAYMYPCIREKVNAPTAEQLVYDELKKLPNDYIIFSLIKNAGREPDERLNTNTALML